MSSLVYEDDDEFGYIVPTMFASSWTFDEVFVFFHKPSERQGYVIQFSI